MPQYCLPESLGEYAHRKTARFHMPGHKGRGMGGFFNAELITWDVTELSFSDDLSNPQTSLLQVQEACAARYGAAQTFLLVNGSTAGLHALLLSLPRGARLLIGRDCHRATLAGAALGGHTVSFVQPTYLDSEALWGCVTPDALEAAMAKAPVDAVILTSPNYYGLCADIPALAKIARQHGALLFVDNAHGAHFPFAKTLPQGPAGHADAWVTSAHKTLNALGQAAMLHIGPRMPAFAVQRALCLIQTSSPSYLLLASLDWALYTASLRDLWAREVQTCHALAKQMQRILGIQPLPRSLIGRAGIYDMDATRLVIDVSGRGLTGYAAQKELEQRDVFVELSDSRRLVLICTPSDDPRWYMQLLRALEQLPYGLDEPAMPLGMYPVLPQALPLHAAIQAPAEECPLEAAAGRIAAECAGLYPPGIPLWAPGERITAESVAFFQQAQQAGASFFGVRQGLVAILN